MSNNETHEVAQIIWQQIPTMTKMACGAREARVTEQGLQFKVGGKPMRYVEVAYNRGSDLYDVVHFRLKRNDYSRVQLESAAGVYAEDLGETIYGMVNK